MDRTSRWVREAINLQPSRSTMKSIKFIRILALASLALVSPLAMSGLHADEVESAATIFSDSNPLEFDVVESMAKFSFDEAPILPSALPAYGTPFTTQGYIYPYGTLEETSGVLVDGSPEFPERVIGEWTCRGYFIGNGAETTTGPWVITTQLFDFYNDKGYAEGKQSSWANLVTEGYEIADVNVESTRAVTGGTGRYPRPSASRSRPTASFRLARRWWMPSMKSIGKPVMRRPTLSSIAHIPITSRTSCQTTYRLFGGSAGYAPTLRG